MNCMIASAVFRIVVLNFVLILPLLCQEHSAATTLRTTEVRFQSVSNESKYFVYSAYEGVNNGR